jgi:hypothetical protein
LSSIEIRHRTTGVLLAAGPLGWGITPFEGNYYISKRYLQAGRFVMNGIPGLCLYKFIYVWLDLHLPGGLVEKSLAWRYVFPNPLLPFIWFRVALPANAAALSYEMSPA